MNDLHGYDDLRGHSLIPDPEQLTQIPKLYATDGVRFADKTIYVHYFCGVTNWYIAEVDTDEWVAFGYCDLGLGFPEWGYVSIRELADLLVKLPSGLALVVERELRFTSRPFSQIVS